MAKIVKSETGHWVGKELHAGERYISFDAVCISHPVEKTSTVDFDALKRDILELLGTEISAKTPDNVIQALKTELCNSKIGMHYLLDWQSPFGVRKIHDAPI